MFKRTIWCCLVLNLWGLSRLNATIVSTPFWRGQEDTSYYHWTFDDNDNPAAPEVSQSINSPWGAAVANITVGDIGDGWKDNFDGQTGLWHIGDNSLNVERIELDIDGLYSTTKPYVFLQIKYYDDSIILAPTLHVAGCNVITNKEISLGDNWYVQETLLYGPDHYIYYLGHLSTLIDEISVDVAHVPEPCSLGLLALSGLILARRRRRSEGDFHR